MSTFERRNYADQLNIETPEQVELQFHVAGIGSRFVAILLDHLIQFVFYIVMVLLLVLVFSGHTGTPSANPDSPKLDTAGKWFLAIFIFLNFCVIWGYFSLFEAFWRGQTPGKRIMKLRVIKDSGRQITLFEALARNLMRVIDYMPGLYLVGVITMLCNKRSKRLGDMAAGTIVIHEGRDEQPLLYQSASFLPPSLPQIQSAAVYAAQQPNIPAMFPADAIARLQPADLQVIDTFFARALDLTIETRAAVGQRIARTMAAKMNVTLPEGNPERALEAMAVQMRGSGRRF